MNTKLAWVAGFAPLALIVATAAAQDGLDTEQQKYSYMLGLDIGQSLKRTELEIDTDALMDAIKTSLADGEPKLKPEQVEEIRAALMQQLQAKQQAGQSESSGKNKEEGAAFMAENKAKDGVQTTESGLQYEVLEAGDGTKPAATDQVTVHYRGTLIDGTEFDSSYSRNAPATFGLNGVIAGWTEGLQLMPVGSKYRFVIPPELAYGERGAGEQIGPDATLVFEVELLEIKGK